MLLRPPCLSPHNPFPSLHDGQLHRVRQPLLQRVRCVRRRQLPVQRRLPALPRWLHQLHGGGLHGLRERQGPFQRRMRCAACTAHRGGWVGAAVPSPPSSPRPRPPRTSTNESQPWRFLPRSTPNAACNVANCTSCDSGSPDTCALCAAGFDPVGGKCQPPIGGQEEGRAKWREGREEGGAEHGWRLFSHLARTCQAASLACTRSQNNPLPFLSASPYPAILCAVANCTLATPLFPVPAANQPPVVAAGISYAVRQGSGTLVVPPPGLLAFASDLEGDELVSEYDDYDDNGDSPGSARFMVYRNGSFEYTPAVNFTGVDNHTFLVLDRWNQVRASVLFNVTAGAVGGVQALRGEGRGVRGGGAGLKRRPAHGGRHRRTAGVAGCLATSPMRCPRSSTASPEYHAGAPSKKAPHPPPFLA
jgi:hypothetical protein